MCVCVCLACVSVCVLGMSLSCIVLRVCYLAVVLLICRDVWVCRCVCTGGVGPVHCDDGPFGAVAKINMAASGNKSMDQHELEGEGGGDRKRRGSYRRREGDWRKVGKTKELEMGKRTGTRRRIMGRRKNRRVRRDRRSERNEDNKNARKYM